MFDCVNHLLFCFYLFINETELEIITGRFLKNKQANKQAYICASTLGKARGMYKNGRDLRQRPELLKSEEPHPQNIQQN